MHTFIHKSVLVCSEVCVCDLVCSRGQKQPSRFPTEAGGPPPLVMGRSLLRQSQTGNQTPPGLLPIGGVSVKICPEIRLDKKMDER